LDEYEKWKKGEAVTAANPDKHAFGVGGRAYLDFIPGILDKRLVFNLYSEFIGYPIKSKVKNYSVAPILAQAAALQAFYSTDEGGQALGAAYYIENEQLPNPNDPAFQAWAANYVYSQIDQAAKEVAELDVTFGYDLTLEFEVSVSGIPLDRNQKLLFAAGLPFNYYYNPGVTIDSADPEKEYTFSINPYASLFLTNLPLPIQLQLGYNIPVFGVNSDARHILVFQAKFFFKF
ncbi:MAG: hypothetical protein LBB83_01070, partial [Treponema sp.]|nr:hypothetical protein [Treponema sp.]